MPYNKLTDDETNIIVNHGTEKPFSGEYDNFYKDGIFICKRCNAPLFSSKSKFEAHCGWPAFDKDYPDSTLRVPDIVGLRTEIECANCKAHLGHVFVGEGLTETDTRHCVNSLSIKFVPAGTELPNVIHE